MIALILGLAVGALTCLGFIVHHMTRMKTMQTQYATHRMIRDLMATNWLPSLEASYHAHIVTTLVVSILPIYTGGLLMFSGDLTSLDTQAGQMPTTAIFVSISVWLLLGVSYRLWRKHQLLNRIWRECTEDGTSN
jgi:hypothetical protein